MNVVVTVKGDLPDLDYKAANRRALKRIGQHVGKKAKALAPRRTGELASLIKPKVNWYSEVRIAPKSSLWHIVEGGTNPHVIKARRAKALKLPGGFARSVLHPGSRPRPHVGPAIESSTDDILRFFAEEYRREWEE